MGNLTEAASLAKEKTKWRKKLIESGFEDQEDFSRNLSHPDLRTNSFEMRDKVLEFYLSLDCLLAHYAAMPKFERKVIELYTQGIMVTKIVKNLKCSEKTARMVIKRYKGLAMMVGSILEMLNTHAGNPHALRPQETVGIEEKNEARQSRIQNSRSAA